MLGERAAAGVAVRVVVLDVVVESAESRYASVLVAASVVISQRSLFAANAVSIKQVPSGVVIKLGMVALGIEGDASTHSHQCPQCQRLAISYLPLASVLPRSRPQRMSFF